MEENLKVMNDLVDQKIAEAVVGTTEALNKLQAHALQALVATSHSQEEDKKIIEQTFVDASMAMGALAFQCPYIGIMPGELHHWCYFINDEGYARRSRGEHCLHQGYVQGHRPGSRVD